MWADVHGRLEDELQPRVGRRAVHLHSPLWFVPPLPVAHCSLRLSALSPPPVPTANKQPSLEVFREKIDTYRNYQFEVTNRQVCPSRLSLPLWLSVD